MHAEGIEGVIVAEDALDGGDHEVAEEAGDESDEEGRHGLHEAGGGGYGHKPGDCAGDAAEGAGLAAVTPFGDGPTDSCRGSGEMGGHESTCGQGTARKGAPSIETEPSDPEQAGPHHAEHHGMWRHVLLGIAEPLSEVERAD